jgi:aarF domain-containing kinase
MSRQSCYRIKSILKLVKDASVRGWVEQSSIQVSESTYVLSSSSRNSIANSPLSNHTLLWRRSYGNTPSYASTSRRIDGFVQLKWSDRNVQFQAHWKKASAKIKPSIDWVLGTGYNARIAIINALYTMQPSTHWARLISILMAEAVTRGDPLAWCYQLPVTAREREYLLEAEAADAAAAKAKRGLWSRVVGTALSLFRLFQLLALFAPVIILGYTNVSYGRSQSTQHRKNVNARRQKWLRLLRKTLERAGPAFIKWGQWAATRADLFPPDFCAELELLHTQAPVHDFPHTIAAVQQAFGFPLNEIFVQFDESPVASGSIGQVHRAVLSSAGARLTGVDAGTVVAVKVRHPGVSEVIERDFGLMMIVAKVLGVLPALNSLRLEESLEQFAAPLREQVDLAREGYYLHAFNYNFRGESRVSFPVPLYPLVSPAVLVETFQNGVHISEYVARGPGAPHNSQLAKVGAQTMLHMMVVDNLVHGDLHPGNILVRLEPAGGQVGEGALQLMHSIADTLSRFTGVEAFRAKAEALDASLRSPSIVLLDAGMATRLSPQDQINMVGLFEAFSRLDASAVATWVLRFAGEEQTCPDPEGFRRELEYHFEALKDASTFEAGNTSSGAEALAAVLESVRQHRVALPGHICATVVTTLVLEGWSHTLDPAHSTLSEVKRIIALKKGETKLKTAAAWIQGAAVDREILEHVPRFVMME